MIRSTCFALICLLAFVGQAKAEFLIDAFSNLDSNSGSGDSVLVHPASPQNAADIFVDMTASGASVTTSGNRYSMNVPTGASTPMQFTLTYSWNNGIAATFGDLQSIAGLSITNGSLPARNILGDWNMLITDGTNDFFDGDLNSFTATDTIIDGATQLIFQFDLVAPDIGEARIDFGGVGRRLFATPEPTGFLMLGCVGVAGLLRRRRK